MENSSIQQIKDRLDIVEVVSGYLKLEKTGINLRARCPFHQEKGPSFFVSPTRQMFKCFGCFIPGSLIKTEQGFHRIEELKIGQTVLTHKGRFKPIVRTLWRPYSGKVLDIKIRKSSEVTSLTSDHEVFAIRTQHCKFKNRLTRICQRGCIKGCSTKFFSNYHIQKIKASELSVGDYLLYPINKEVCDVKIIDLEKYSSWRKGIYGFNPRHFSTNIKVDNNFLKFIGYYIAEGSNNRAFIRFSLSNQEIDFAEEIRDLAKKLFGFNAGIHIRDKNKKGKSGIEVSICNSKLSNIFANLLGRGSKNKHIPFEFQYLPSNKQAIILDAIFRGDGYYRKRRDGREEKVITTTSPVLMEQIRDILLRMGIAPSVLVYKEKIDKKNVHHKKSFVIRWQKDYLLNYSNFYYNKESNVHYWASPIKEIKERDYKGNVFNLTVADDHSYVASNFVVGNCGASGSVFDFVMKIEGIEFPDALRILAKRAGVELHEYHPQDQTERMRLLEICDLAAKFFEKQLQETVSGKKCQEYLKKRGLTDETIKQWRLGYAVDQWRALSDFLVGRGFKREEIVKAGLAVEQEKAQSPYDRFRARIVFPIFDFNGQVIGFGARKTDFLEGSKDQGPKYLNTPNSLLYDKSRALYGLHFAKMDIRQKNFCILTEGYMDVILSHQAGFTNTVASSGTALTPFQLSVIKRYTSNLHTAFDRDIAGSSATQRGIDLAQKENFDIKVILMPPGKDPADIISQNPAEWQTAIDSAKDITEFYFEDAFLKFDASSPQGKKQIAAFLLPQIKKLPNSILQSHWSQKLAQALGVSAESISQELKKIPSVTNLSDRPNLKQGQNEKTRFQLLEEKILALTLKTPQFLDFMDKDDIGLFSPHFKTVLTCFKEKAVCDQATLETAVKDFESDFEVKTILDSCFFQAETEQIDDVEQEMQICLEYFRRVAWQSQLKKDSDELKLAEGAGDLQKKKEIIDKINFLTKNRPA